MIVLHAIWDNSIPDGQHLYLWAEISKPDTKLNNSTTAAGTRKSARSKAVAGQAHPFAAPVDLLKDCLQELVPAELLKAVTATATAATAVPQTFSLRLPTDSNGPLSSPELILEDERAGGGKVGLVGWQIPGLAFAPAQALELLLKLPVQLPPNVGLGSSVRFWVEAAKFCLEILIRQNFEPAIFNKPKKGKKVYRAGWKMSLNEEADLARLALLHKAMPPVCRAIVSLPGSGPNSGQPAKFEAGGGGLSPAELVGDFLNQTLEATLRQSLQADANLKAAFSKTGGAKTAVEDLPSQWLRGLYAAAGDEPGLAAPATQLKAFVEQLESWLAQLKPVDNAAPFRTCFKLEPFPYDNVDSQAEYIRATPTTKATRTTTKTTAAAATATTTTAKTTTELIEDDLSETPPWLLTFYLQANSDRSLLIEADQVWRERSGTLTFLKRQFENPQERLLADLGKASRMYPTLEKSLKTARPAGLTLDTEEAYNFLRQSALLLEQSGFGVILPPWWNKPSQKLGLKLRMTPKGEGESQGKTSSGLLGKEKLVEYDWQLALGDQPLTQAEFEKLARLKVPLVQLRGQWVELPPEQIEAAIAFFAKQQAKAGGQLSLEEALKLGLGGQVELANLTETGLSVNGVESNGWLAHLLERLSQSSKISEVPQPAGLQASLRPYQLKGLAWLSFLNQYELGACLADDMGLGKTIQLISLLLHERETAANGNGHGDAESNLNGNGKTQGSGKTNGTGSARGKGKDKSKNTGNGQAETVKTGPTLLVCPMSVVGNWSKELARFAPSLRLLIHHGNQRLSGAEFVEAAAQADVVLTTYALLARDIKELGGVEWERVALDEAQNIKNPAAKQTQAVRSLQARYRVALTGTPVENRLSELWSIMHFLNPGYLGTATEFRTRYATPIEKYHDKERSEQLKRLIQPFVLRRLKTDKSIIADLPDKMEMKVWCNLTREQASLYEAVVKDMLAQIEEAAESGIQRRGLILATLLKLKQVCNHPAQFMGDRNGEIAERSGKLIRLEEMLEEALAEGDKALLFTQFAEMGGMLKPYLQQRLGREVLFLHGGTSRKLRDEMVQRFQDTRPGSPPIFLLSLKAGGVGLNLTAANHVFHFDRWWNPAVENQATDRAFRIGQHKNVQVHKFVCIGTLEERIDAMIEQKKGLAESIVGQSENWLTELSNKELRQLFALDKSALGD